MKLKVKARVKIEDGVHVGEVTGIEYKTSPHQYTDIVIKLDGFDDLSLKYGCPTILSEGSRLYKLISKFAEAKVDDEIDLEQTLVGKKVQFMTQQEIAKDGNEYARIVPNSVKPAEGKTNAAE